MKEKINMDAIQIYCLKELLHSELLTIVGQDDLEAFKKILLSPTFSALPKNILYNAAFNTTYLNFDTNGFDKALKYLIFDYQIKEEDSLHLVKGPLNLTVKKMFETRKLNRELNEELQCNTRPNKKIKI